jgi:ribonuclease-3
MNHFCTNHLKQLEQDIDYYFQNPQLLEEALSHPSLKQHNIPHQNYERLELLGDSLLGFLVTELLYHQFPASEESNLAKIKAYLVCKDTLCKIAQDIHLADYIMMTKGEEISGGRLNPNNIENSLEALLAAIYLDSDLLIVKNIIHRLWLPYLNDINFNIIDPKTYLQEWAQGNGYGIPIYEIIDQTGPQHEPIFTVQVTIGANSQTGKGSSRKYAEKDAARKLYIT